MFISSWRKKRKRRRLIIIIMTRLCQCSAPSLQGSIRFTLTQNRTAGKKKCSQKAPRPKTTTTNKQKTKNKKSYSKTVADGKDESELTQADKQTRQQHQGMESLHLNHHVNVPRIVIVPLHLIVGAKCNYHLHARVVHVPFRKTRL